MDSIDRLARKITDMHKDNRNPNSTAPRICVVVGTNPLLLQWGQNIVIDSDKIILPRLYSAGIQVARSYLGPSGDAVNENLMWKIDLQIGDRVIVAPDEGLKTWYLIDQI